MSKTDKDDQLAFIRTVVKNPFWNAAYHEAGLPNCRRNVAFVVELMKRAGIDEHNVERADIDGEGERVCKTVEEYACSLFDDAVNLVEYHESELQKAHNEIAMVKIMMARGGYTSDEIDLVEIEQEQRKKLLK